MSDDLAPLRAQVLAMAFELGHPFPPVDGLSLAQLELWRVKLHMAMRKRPIPEAMVEA